MIEVTRKKNHLEGAFVTEKKTKSETEMAFNTLDWNQRQILRTGWKRLLNDLEVSLKNENSSNWC